jgi:hypothetical protein
MLLLKLAHLDIISHHVHRHHALSSNSILDDDRVNGWVILD